MADARHDTARAQSRSLFAAFLRLVWMLVGHVALLLVILLVAMETDGGLSGRDAIAAIIVLTTLAARYVDIARYGGETAEGAAATMAHFRAHLVRLLLGGGAALAAAHLVAHLLARR